MSGVVINLEFSVPQYEMLMDCLQTAETKWRFNATSIDSENTNYANRIKYLAEMIDKAKKVVE